MLLGATDDARTTQIDVLEASVRYLLELPILRDLSPLVRSRLVAHVFYSNKHVLQLCRAKTKYVILLAFVVDNVEMHDKLARKFLVQYLPRLAHFLSICKQYIADVPHTALPLGGNVGPHLVLTVPTVADHPVS